MKNNNYIPFEKFVLRTHIFPLNRLDVFLTKVLDADLRSIANDKVFMEAIYISSPILYKRINDWLQNKPFSNKELDNLYFSIIKYFIRMSSRCTPFGLMAACTTGVISSETNIELAPYKSWNKKSNLDMDYLFLFVKHIEQDPVLLEKVKFFSNSSIYLFNSKIRMVEYQLDENKEKKYKIVSYESNEILEKLIKSSKKGLTIKELAKLITCDDISIDEAIEFIKELILNQILISEIEPAISGIDCFERIKKQLFKLNKENNLYVSKLQNCLKEVDNNDLGESLNTYPKILKLLNLRDVNFEVKYLFNTNLYLKKKNCLLSKNIIDKIEKTIYIIQQIDNNIINNNLEVFKKEFYDRFESREIPLSIVLDAESGIGYGENIDNDSDNIVNRNIEIQYKNINNSNFSLTPFFEYMLYKYSHSIKDNKREIVLQEQELLKLFNLDKPVNYAPTITACVSVYNSSNDSNIIHLHWFGGPCSKFIARFGQSNNDIKDLIREITSYEEDFYGDKIVAEIVHLPDARLGNILIRPNTYKYEIPYLANSDIKAAFRIDINDLYVSLRNSKIVLKSRSLNKEIIPCLSSAQNYMLSSLPIYRFLCDLQYQNFKKGYSFNWDILDDTFIYLPRVTLNDIILYPETWNIRIEELRHLFNIKNDEELLNQFNIWRESIKLPILVKFVESDNELIIFFNNVKCIRMFISLIKQKDRIKLKELIFDLKSENFISNTDGGGYNNEFLLSFKRIKNN